MSGINAYLQGSSVETSGSIGLISGYLQHKHMMGYEFSTQFGWALSLIHTSLNIITMVTMLPMNISGKKPCVQATSSSRQMRASADHRSCLGPSHLPLDDMGLSTCISMYVNQKLGTGEPKG